MTAFAHDIRYAFRQLLRTPAFTSAAIVTLALGIGVNTAFFAIVNAVIYRPMRSLQLEGVYQPSWNRRGQGYLPLAHYRMLESNLPDMVEAVDGQSIGFRDVVAHIPGRAERVQMLAVSGAHAQVFRVQPQAGRFITPADDRGQAPSVVISDRIWREWFAGDRQIVERAMIRINDQAYQIVGVAPPGYRGIFGFGLASVDLWIPLSRARSPYEGSATVQTFLLLKPGADPDGVAPAVHAVIREADKEVRSFARIGSSSLTLTRADDGNPLRIAGLILLGLSSLVLVAACANLANMLYVRGVHRRAEMAVRQALGASSGRVFRLLVAEAAMIGAASILAGLAIALAATRYFNDAFPLFRDRAARVEIDLSPDYYVFGYALAAGAAAALLVGAVTAWRASRVPPLRGMAVGDAATSVTRSSRQTRLALVAVQVCIAVLLLMAAATFYQQTRGLFEGGLRFDTRSLATARVDLSRHGYNLHNGRAFLRRLNTEVAALPGIDRAVVADGMPGGAYLGGAGITFFAERTDLPFTRYIKLSNRRAEGRLVATYPGFVEALGIRVLRGRDLQQADHDGSELVVLMSEAMAEGLWPGEDALGKRMMFGNEGFWRTVVGIFQNPLEPLPPATQRRFDPSALVVMPFEQRYPDELGMTRAQAEKQAKEKGEDAVIVLARNFAAREAARVPREMLIIIRAADARGRLDAVRQHVAALDPNVAVFEPATVDESILAEMAPRRAGRLILGALGVAALTIATLGIYSVISFLVARRTREFGIRMALGAQKRQVVKMVVDDAVHLLLVGLLAGVFLASVGERLLGVRAAGLMPNEISTWTVVLSGILIVGLAAAFIPARRAAGIDPNVALRDL